jgi:phytoene dehydrogenase-like protein
VCGTHVEAIVHAGERVTGLRLRDGTAVAADAVVIATSPQAAGKLVPESQRLQRKVTELVPAYVACLDVALRHLPQPHSAIAQDLDRPCFLSAQSVYSQVAPEGKALVYTFRQLDPREPGDPEAHAAELEALLDSVQPGWRAALVRRRWLPRIAALGALPLAATGGYAGRPGPEVPDMAGLYVAGDWVGPGFLADASFGSARHAAQLVLERARSERTQPDQARLALAR